jgi:hypothetical protein
MKDGVAFYVGAFPPTYAKLRGPRARLVAAEYRPYIAMRPQVEVVPPPEWHGEVWSPAIAVRGPGVVVGAPGIEVEAPGVAVVAPSVSFAAPSIAVSAPGVVVGAPGVYVGGPRVVEDRVYVEHDHERRGTSTTTTAVTTVGVSTITVAAAGARETKVIRATTATMASTGDTVGTDRSQRSLPGLRDRRAALRLPQEVGVRSDRVLEGFEGAGWKRAGVSETDPSGARESCFGSGCDAR